MFKLVIQDDDATSRLMARQLAGQGFEVIETPFGEEGIEFARVYIIDLILVDDVLPDMSGFEILRQLKRFGVTAPSVFVSSAAHEPDIAAQARALGAQRVMGLPFDHAGFLQIVGDLAPAARGFGPYCARPDAG